VREHKTMTGFKSPRREATKSRAGMGTGLMTCIHGNGFAISGVTQDLLGTVKSFPYSVAKHRETQLEGDR